MSCLVTNLIGHQEPCTSREAMLIRMSTRLNGKPGSGKSTLMKYITSEFRKFCGSQAALRYLGSGADLVTCSFFFWALGSPMQKNYVGFLRSLLYQIAEQREDLIPIMMGQETISEAITSQPREPVRIYAWTKERLEDALRRFLSGKPSSISVCLFIDGLDEFAGDEDLLMGTARLLSQTPRTHVCVSSRPEQIFRQGFANSPQLRLQDLNYEDIEKATKDRLDTALREEYPQEPWMTDRLVENVIDKAQGIFLWAELVTKDLKKGARNSDSIQELHKRLDRTPNTIEGLYEHMLERLDKSYFQDAARYFQMITANQELLALQTDVFEYIGSRNTHLTLLHCACADEKAWNYVLSHDLGHFQSPGFRDLCYNLETRILTRCAGLVEVSEHRQKILTGIFHRQDEIKFQGAVRTDQGAQSLSYHLREVKFIHKTVMDFLQSHKEFFQNLDWRLTATLTISRGAMGVMSLTPIIMCEEDASLGPFAIDEVFIMILLSGPSWIEALWPAQSNCEAISDSTIQVVDQAYEVLDHVSRSLNGSDQTCSNLFHRGKDYKSSFHDCLGFASYFGRHEYASRYTARNNRIKEDAEYVLSCTFSGLHSLDRLNSSGIEAFGVRKTSVLVGGFFRIVMDCLPQSRESQLCMESKWVIFLNCSTRHITTLLHWRSDLGRNFQYLQQVAQSIILWKDTVACFLHYDADSNTNLEGWLYLFCSNKDEIGSVTIRVAETFLAWIRRTFGFVDPAIREEMEDLLKSHSGQHRRIILSLSLDSGPDFRLTREQSDCLLHACSFEDGCLPAEDPSSWSVIVDKEDQEPVAEDPMTERTLKKALEYIDRIKADRKRRILHLGDP